MNELHASIRLLNLELFDDECDKRKNLTLIYEVNLKDIYGNSYLNKKKDVEYNFQYFPILIIVNNSELTEENIGKICEMLLYCQKKLK